MQPQVLQLNPNDNLLVALRDLKQGETLSLRDQPVTLLTDVSAKHKISLEDLSPGDAIIMYGVKVGQAIVAIRKGEAVTTRNIRHDAADFQEEWRPFSWNPPDVSKWSQQPFFGYHRADGQVGTRNYWLVLPLVFCENRNLGVLKQAFDEELGFVAPQVYRRHVTGLVRLLREGKLDQIGNLEFPDATVAAPLSKVFPNVDGIKFLFHESGCGGTREDTNNLCGLLAGYLHHPNVAGATVLSLGCQHAQVAILQAEIEKRDPHFTKPLLIFEQQKYPSERRMLSAAIRDTFLGLVEANHATRAPAPLSALSWGSNVAARTDFPVSRPTPRSVTFPI